MKRAKYRRTPGWRRALAAAAAVLALPALAGPALAVPAHPVHRATPEGGFEELLVPSSMGPVKVQVQWARHGGDAALYLLDGLRARDDFNAWTFETNALRQFAEDNVTLVMPVGGQS
ncbi:esterase family protein, partial [Nocardia sp. NPDC004722]